MAGVSFAPATICFEAFEPEVQEFAVSFWRQSTIYGNSQISILHPAQACQTVNVTHPRNSAPKPKNCSLLKWKGIEGPARKIYSRQKNSRRVRQ